MKYNQQVYLGYDPVTGKQIRKWFHADTKADLKRQVEQYKLDMQNAPNPSDVTFGKYSQEWLRISKGTKSKQTQDAARTHLRKCAALDPYPLRKITRSQLQQIVNESWDRPHAAKGVADVLRQVFQMAQNDGIIPRNPALNLDRPKLHPPTFHLLTDREIEAVKRADLDDQDRLFVTILQTFGLRPAEALALVPADFDLKSRTLHISKALEMTNDNKSRVKGTKTEAVRDIPIPDALIPALRARFRGKSGFLLFEKGNGGLYTKSAYKRMQARIWSKVNEALGGDTNHNLVAPCSFYDFRHWRATQWYYLCQSGVISTKQAAALLGHSEMIFLTRYSHLDPNREKLTEIYPDFEEASVRNL